MTKSNQEVEKIEQLLADPWAIDIERHKPARNAENYLFVTMKSTFEYWYSDVNVRRTNQ